MPNLEQQLEQLLRDFRYASMRDGQFRGLMEHHIQALKAALLPFIRQQISREILATTNAAAGIIEDVLTVNGIEPYDEFERRTR